MGVIFILHTLLSSDADYPAHYEDLRHDCEPATALYSRLDLEYLQCYPEPWASTDLSVAWQEDGIPLAALVMCASRHAAGSVISGFGRPVYYLERRGLAPATRKEIDKAVRTWFDRIVTEHQPDVIYYQCPSGSLTPPGKWLMEQGAQAVPALFRTIDLGLPLETLKQGMRRSFKSLVNQGLRTLGPMILDHSNVREEDFRVFQELHQAAAGRKTRSDQSWDMNLKMIREGKAFLVTGHLSGAMVTAALFLVDAGCCYYAVAASRRDLFDMPLGHCIVWLAIAHARDLGLHRLEMGQIHHPGQEYLEFNTRVAGGGACPLPTQKQRGISDFKSGFGGDTDIRLDLLWRRHAEQHAVK